MEERGQILRMPPHLQHLSIMIYLCCRLKPRISRNAEKLLTNIYAADHSTSEALFIDTPELCDYMWKDFDGKRCLLRAIITIPITITVAVTVTVTVTITCFDHRPLSR